MKSVIIPRPTLLIILLGGLLSCLFIYSQSNTLNQYFENQWNTNSASAINVPFSSEPKQKGAHVFGRIDSTIFQPLIQNNIKWVTLVSWSSQDDFDSPNIRHHYGDSLQIQENDARWIKRIELLRAAGFKVFVKPHVWIDEPSNETWRSDIFPVNEKNWESWKTSYRNFILRYAKLAELAKAEMFCIGVEFSRLSVEKPAYWKELIREVRTVYSGKLTYAANWYNEYEKITFWEDLDFIGIQAYFPLVKTNSPSVQEISKGWNKHLSSIKSIHKKYKRKILFTEMGYKSTADSAIEPWLWIESPSDQEKVLSTETQANCYQAFFNTVWKKEWFAGVHIWQLRSEYKNQNQETNLDFTPQGKPAELIIAKEFGNSK